MASCCCYWSRYSPYLVSTQFLHCFQQRFHRKAKIAVCMDGLCVFNIRIISTLERREIEYWQNLLYSLRKMIFYSFQSHNICCSIPHNILKHENSRSSNFRRKKSVSHNIQKFNSQYITMLLNMMIYASQSYKTMIYSSQYHAWNMMIVISKYH